MSKYMDCPRCGQDLNLSPGAEIELSELQEEITHLREENKDLKHDRDFNSKTYFKMAQEITILREEKKRLIEVGNFLHDFCSINHRIDKKSCEWIELLNSLKEDSERGEEK